MKNDVSESFYAQHKLIRRNGVSLSDPSFRCKPIEHLPISEDQHSRSIDAVHNVSNPSAVHANIQESIPDEIPIEPVIGFFKVNLEHHVSRSPFHGSHGVENFLVNDYVISNLAIKDKTTLGRAKQLSHDLFEMVGHDFCYHLLRHVT